MADTGVQGTGIGLSGGGLGGDGAELDVGAGELPGHRVLKRGKGRRCPVGQLTRVHQILCRRGASHHAQCQRRGYQPHSFEHASTPRVSAVVSLRIRRSELPASGSQSLAPDCINL